jgi:NAD dependent epimerase/dehydratase family enzyme
VFDTLLSLVRFGLGGTAGSGQQFISWIHDADFRSAIEFLIARDEIAGSVNLSSPNPIPNLEFMRALRGAWGTRIGLPAANWVLEIGSIFLRTETELVLKSRRVIPGRLLEAGFHFQFPYWASAVQDLIARWRATDNVKSG